MEGVKDRDKVTDPFDIANACIGHRFNPDHPNISKVYPNVNLEMGPDHWRFRSWNPNFGDISRYTLCEWIGEGRYSDVFDALQDHSVRCAIKMLKPVNADRVRRELKILTVVQSHPSILKLLDIVIDGREGIPAMVTEYVPNASWRNLFETFDLDDLRFYTYRIVQALARTHSLGVMHRDVKPLNILCKNPRGQVVLADWGLAEFYHPMRKYSIHVATRYYKSPEILLGYEYYDYSIDMWSIGVIMLEVMTMKLHIFDGGNDQNQIFSVAEFTGGQEILEWADKYRVNIPQSISSKLGQFRKPDIETLISFGRRAFRDEIAIDLVKNLLIVDHKERITAEEALQHPFFDTVREFDAKQKQ